MYIYIDESGSFTCPNVKKRSISCVAGLVVPECEQTDLFSRFQEMISTWGSPYQEIKGSKLNEKQISSVINLLEKHDVILKIVGIDLGFHIPFHIAYHKQMQAHYITRNVTSLHHPNIANQLTEYKERLRSLADNLYTQSVAMTLLVDSIIRVSTLYYSQCKSSELGSFRWIIDAKDKAKTEYEDLWSFIVVPALQSTSLQKPLIQLKEGDYSDMERFFNKPGHVPEHLRPYVQSSKESFLSMDIKLLMKERIIFGNSIDYIGLQIVDILANAVRRAMNGRLGIEGWRRLGRLMIRGLEEENAIRLFCLFKGRMPEKHPYTRVVKIFDAYARPILCLDDSLHSIN